MPNSSLAAACQTTERLTACIAAEPSLAAGETTPMLTPALEWPPWMGHTPPLDGLIKRADQALCVATRDGRNKVVADAA